MNVRYPLQFSWLVGALLVITVGSGCATGDQRQSGDDVATRSLPTLSSPTGVVLQRAPTASSALPAVTIACPPTVLGIQGPATPDGWMNSISNGFLVKAYYIQNIHQVGCSYHSGNPNIEFRYLYRSLDATLANCRVNPDQKSVGCISAAR